MECPECKNKIEIRVASKLNCKGCHILTQFTTVLSVRCDHCNNIFQVPISSKSFFSVKEDK